MSTHMPRGRASYLLRLIRGVPSVVSGRQAHYCPILRMKTGSEAPRPAGLSVLAEKGLRQVCGVDPGRWLFPCSAGTAARWGQRTAHACVCARV